MNAGDNVLLLGIVAAGGVAVLAGSVWLLEHGAALLDRLGRRRRRDTGPWQPVPAVIVRCRVCRRQVQADVRRNRPIRTGSHLSRDSKGRATRETCAGSLQAPAEEV